MLNKTMIQNEIKSAFTAVMYQDEDRDQALDTLSSKLADAVMNAIKSLTINYQSGLANAGGAVTGVMVHTVS